MPNSKPNRISDYKPFNESPQADKTWGEYSYGILYISMVLLNKDPILVFQDFYYPHIYKLSLNLH